MTPEAKNRFADTISYPLIKENTPVHSNTTSEKNSTGYPHLQILEIEITLRCPLRCLHCSVNGGEKKIDLPLEKFYEVVDDCEKLGVEVLDIIGGEPLTYPHIYEAIKYSLTKIPKVFLNTSGYFINRRILEKLGETGLKDVFISLDGATPQNHEKIRGTNTFSRTCKAIKELSDFGFRVTVSFVANAENYTDIPEILKICENHGARKLFILSLIPQGRGKNIEHLKIKDNMIKYIFDTVKSYKGNVEVEFDCSIKLNFSKLPEYVKVCPAGATFCTIKANGDVIPCGFLPDHFTAGNIYERRFYDIWRDNSAFGSLRRAISGCNECAIYNECRGGCQALKVGKACDGKPEKRFSLYKELGISS